MFIPDVYWSWCFPSGKCLHDYGKAPLFIGKSPVNVLVSIALIVYQKVLMFGWFLFLDWLEHFYSLFGGMRIDFWRNSMGYSSCPPLERPWKTVQRIDTVNLWIMLWSASCIICTHQHAYDLTVEMHLTYKFIEKMLFSYRYDKTS